MVQSFLLKFTFFSILIGVVISKWLFSNGELLGGGEAYGHAWSHWKHMNEPPSGFQWAIGDNSMHSIDPLPSLISGVIGRIANPTVGYNSWIVICVAMAAYGGWKLARALGGNPFVGAVALAWSPPFIGALRSGLTEDGAIGLTALALAATYENKGLKAGFMLGLSAWCGILLGWVGALTVGLLGLSRLYSGDMKLKTLAICGLTALLITIPAALPHVDRIIYSDIQPAIAGSIENWQVNPTLHVDLLSFFNVGRFEVENNLFRIHPGYMGISIIAAALLSKRWPMLIAGCLLGSLSLGPTLYANGSQIIQINPIHWLFDFVPGSQSVRHHGRVLLGASVILAGAASIGARKIKGKSWIIVIIGALDLFCLSPVSPRLPITKATTSTALNALRDMPHGYLVPIPVAGPGISHQEALWIQRLHKKPLRINPNRPGLSRKETNTPFGKWLNGLAFSSENFSGQIELDSVDYLAVKSGYAQRISSLLGPANISDDEWKIWVLNKGWKKEQKNSGKSMN